MANIKIPMYILYYIDVANNKLVKDSVIYQTEIISSSDVLSATSGNLISFKVPKFDHAIDNVVFKPQPRWSTIMNNQTEGNKLYFIVSSNSYNSDEFLEDPIFTPTNRTNEEAVNAYSPLFSGYLTKIICNRDSDFIQFDFNGFDWVYENKILSANRNKLDDSDSADYEYANFFSSYDPSGLVSLGNQDNPTILPAFTSLPGSSDPNTNILEKESNTILRLKREGLHHIKLDINLQHTEVNMSTVHVSIYRDVCAVDTPEQIEEGKVLIGNMVCELEGGSTATKTFTFQTIEGENYDVPSIYQKWLYEESISSKSNVRNFDLWIEVYSNASTTNSVTYSYTDFYISTGCWSLDHDQVYNAKWNSTTPLKLSEVLQTFMKMTPRSIMDSSKIIVDESIIPSEDSFFDDKIITLDDVQSRLGYLSTLNSWFPSYNYNKWSTTIKSSCDEIMKSKNVLPTWMTYLYSNGKICPDPGAGEPRNIQVETTYNNTDARYNISTDYSNHFYTKIGGESDKPDNHFHTISHTLGQYRNGDGTIWKDPICQIRYNSYEGTEKNDTMTDEDMWNTMGIFNEQKANEYILNKHSYIYYPDETLIPDCRIGDRIVSTPESPFQINRAITTIGRVCENGIIKWIYKMEGE